MSTSITSVQITYVGGTEDECRALTDAITYVLIEHGINVGEMKQWTD